MSFMELEIESAAGWQVVETADGETSYVPPGFGVAIGETCDFCESFAPVVSVEVLTRGWMGRYSAPGYMDATEWVYNTSRQRLEDELEAMYGDDDSDSDDEA